NGLVELCHARRLLTLLRFPLFHPDFFVERVSQLVGRPLEFGEAFPERLAELGQLARPENDEGDGEDDDEFRKPDIAHIWPDYTPRKSATMRSMRTPRFFLVAALAVLLSALAGGIFGGTAPATQDQVTQQYRVVTAAPAAGHPRDGGPP